MRVLGMMCQSKLENVDAAFKDFYTKLEGSADMLR